MSIAAFIMKPEELKNEGGMYVPVSTEEFFYNVWVPIIEKLELKWLAHMSFGLDITNENLQEVLKELGVLSTWVQESEHAYCTALQERITNLEAMLHKAFAHKNVVVYIG